MKTRKDRELLSAYLCWERLVEGRSKQFSPAQGLPLVAQRKPATVLQLQAQRRNVRHSTGPRTREGKHRSSLNSTKWRLEAPFGQTTIALKGGNPFQFRRLQRYLLHLFQPWDGPSEQRVAYLARVWWKKIGEPPALPLPAQFAQLESELRRERTLWYQNRRIRSALESCVCALAAHNRQWKYVLSKRLGRHLRRHIRWDALRRILESDFRAANIPAEHRRVVHFRKGPKNLREDHPKVKRSQKTKMVA